MFGTQEKSQHVINFVSTTKQEVDLCLHRNINNIQELLINSSMLVDSDDETMMYLGQQLTLFILNTMLFENKILFCLNGEQSLQAFKIIASDENFLAPFEKDDFTLQADELNSGLLDEPFFSDLIGRDIFGFFNITLPVPVFYERFQFLPSLLTQVETDEPVLFHVISGESKENDEDTLVLKCLNSEIMIPDTIPLSTTKQAIISMDYGMRLYEKGQFSIYRLRIMSVFECRSLFVMSLPAVIKTAVRKSSNVQMSITVLHASFDDVTALLQLNKGEIFNLSSSATLLGDSKILANKRLYLSKVRERLVRLMGLALRNREDNIFGWVPIADVENEIGTLGLDYWIKYNALEISSK